jgi:hypothetical protein
VLVPVGGAGALVTDGVFFPDGKHLVLRDYGSATVLRTRNFASLGNFALPAQEQGEGIAVQGDHVVVSSEGRHAPVRTAAVPPALRQLMQPEPTPSPSPTATATPRPVSTKTAGPWDRNVVPFALGAGWLVVLAFGVRAFRRRSRRRP